MERTGAYGLMAVLLLAGVLASALLEQHTKLWSRLEALQRPVIVRPCDQRQAGLLPR